MKRAFVYKDEKSHKFWWIDYSDCSFAVNYGKYGSIGKFEVTGRLSKGSRKVNPLKNEKRLYRRREL